MSDQQSIARRLFLKSGLAAGAAGLGSTLATAEAASKSDRIPTRPFGRTGRRLPIFGVGGSAMVDKWATAYGVKLRGFDERAAMIRYAFEKGIRYFDTARVYDESESIMGAGLKGVRDQVFLATKVAVRRRLLIDRLP